MTTPPVWTVRALAAALYTELFLLGRSLNYQPKYTIACLTLATATATTLYVVLRARRNRPR